MLVKHAIPSGERFMGGKFLFQQDNNPKQTSIFLKKYLKSRQKDGNSANNQSEPIMGVSSNYLGRYRRKYAHQTYKHDAKDLQSCLRNWYLQAIVNTLQ